MVSAPVVTTLHPAAILRGGGAGEVSAGKQKMNVDAQLVFIEADVAKAYALATDLAINEWRDDIELITDDSLTNQHKIFRALDAAVLSGMLAIDLEWGKDGLITWLGLASWDKVMSNDYNAISIYWPRMPRALVVHVASYGWRDSLPKLFHNLQADIKVWEKQIGPIQGVLEDTMLMHHAAYPGAAHDLQNVASQFLLVPPWKADRRNETKQAARDFVKAEKQAKKSVGQIEHELRNAQRKADGVTRKRARKSQLSTADVLKLIEGGGNSK